MSNSMPPEKRMLFELHAKLSVFQRKVDYAQNLVARAVEKMEHPYCAWSSGKDSTVASHLVWSVNPGVPGVYFDADCAFPETYEYLDLIAKQHTIIKWQTEPMLDTFERLGGPNAKGIENATMKSTVYEPLKAMLEHYQFDGVFLGLRSEESEGRAKTAKYHGTLYQYKRDDVWRCLPVAYFSYLDIWAYIISHNLPYNRVYDKMWELPIEDQRVSYYAGETKRCHGRWVFLRQHYVELWNKFSEKFPEVREYC
jgi:phosphoadenosine phosphosulfate reductase